MRYTIVALTTCALVGVGCAGTSNDTSSGMSEYGATGSGRTTPSSASSPIRGSTASAFETLDANADGALTADELDRAGLSQQEFKSLDKDLDGRVNQAEYESSGALAPNDRGGDGVGNGASGSEGSSSGPSP
jgi:hypothetical protein